MTLKDIAKQLTTAVQTVPNLVQILRDGLEQATAGSTVEVTQVVSSGTKIASVTVDDETTDLYAPANDTKVFIDTANKITGDTGTGSLEYTATQDCFIKIYCVARSGVDGNIKIDNVTMAGWIYSGTAATTFNYYLKAGQVVTVTNLDTTYDSSYDVYALK